MSAEASRRPPSESGRVLIALARSCHPAPTVAVTLAMTALAAGTERSAAWALGVGLSVLVGQLSVGWSNDGLDARRDRAVGRTDKPAALGDVAPTTLMRCAVAALLVALVLSVAVAGWRAAACHAVLLVSAWAYNVGLKSTRWSLVPYAVGFGALPGMVTYGAGRAPQWWVVAAGALLGLAAGLANAADDVDQDLRTGVRGAVASIGAAPARLLGVGALLAATVVLVVGGSVDAIAGTLLLLGAAAAALAGLLLACGRRLFVAVLGIAIAEVLLVVLV
jgi:4-hydroxybenzoate polyprenyltransferase